MEIILGTHCAPMCMTFFLSDKLHTAISGFNSWGLRLATGEIKDVPQ